MITAIYNETNPVGFDYQVNQIQQALGQLNLIEAIYGVARRQCEIREQKGVEDKVYLQGDGKKGISKLQRWYPQARKAGSTVDLTFDDTYGSRIFFFVEDKINVNPKQNTWEWTDGLIEIKQSFSIILHINVDKTIVGSEQIKLLILKALNNCPKLIVNEVVENGDAVWKEFTTTTEINGFSIYPFYVARFECDIYYFAYPPNNALLSNPPRYIAAWNYCRIFVNVVALPNPSNTQTLPNGDIIPIEYSLNGDNTVTVPYLNSVKGINALSRFLLNNDYYEGNFFIGSNINTSFFGVLGNGDKLEFDISYPVWSI